MTRLLLPELTTIQQPIQEMAEAAVELLKEKIAGEPAVQYRTLPVKLVEGRLLSPAIPRSRCGRGIF